MDKFMSTFDPSQHPVIFIFTVPVANVTFHFTTNFLVTSFLVASQMG